MLRVAVIGATGRMGGETCRAVAADPELELVGAVSRSLTGSGADRSDWGVPARSSIDGLSGLRPEVVVDFTSPAATLAHAHWCVDHGAHLVVGVSGLDGYQLSELEGLFVDGAPNCVVAPNFALGAVVLTRLAEVAAPFFDSVEIVELHHDAKVDAPSGTALSTAEVIAAARESAGAGELRPDPTRRFTIDGTRGGVGAGGVRIHSVRLHGLVAHQEVLFGTDGQSLTLRHDSYDRSSFMPGVLLAVKAVPGRRGLTVGLAALLGL